MASNWLVCVDESVWAYYAFQFACGSLQKSCDHLYLVCVNQQPNFWSSVSEIESVATKSRSTFNKRILAFYFALALDKKIATTPIMGHGKHAGETICSIIETFKIHHAVAGRRGLSEIRRIMVGSTSRYIMENASCNVAVVKQIPPHTRITTARELHNMIETYSLQTVAKGVVANENQEIMLDRDGKILPTMPENSILYSFNNDKPLARHEIKVTKRQLVAEVKRAESEEDEKERKRHEPEKRAEMEEKEKEEKKRGSIGRRLSLKKEDKGERIEEKSAEKEKKKQEKMEEKKKKLQRKEEEKERKKKEKEDREKQLKEEKERKKIEKKEKRESEGKKKKKAEKEAESKEHKEVPVGTAPLETQVVLEADKEKTGKEEKESRKRAKERKKEEKEVKGIKEEDKEEMISIGTVLERGGIEEVKEEKAPKEAKREKIKKEESKEKKEEIVTAVDQGLLDRVLEMKPGKREGEEMIGLVTVLETGGLKPEVKIEAGKKESRTKGMKREESKKEAKQKKEVKEKPEREGEEMIGLATVLQSGGIETPTEVKREAKPERKKEVKPKEAKKEEKGGEEAKMRPGEDMIGLVTVLGSGGIETQTETKKGEPGKGESRKEEKLKTETREGEEMIGITTVQAQGGIEQSKEVKEQKGDKARIQEKKGEKEEKREGEEMIGIATVQGRGGIEKPKQVKKEQKGERKTEKQEAKKGEKREKGKTGGTVLGTGQIGTIFGTGFDKPTDKAEMKFGKEGTLEKKGEGGKESDTELGKPAGYGREAEETPKSETGVSGKEEKQDVVKLH